MSFKQEAIQVTPAVPVNLVQKVMRDIIDYGIVQRGYLGVQIADITQEIQTERDLPNLKGMRNGWGC